MIVVTNKIKMKLDFAEKMAPNFTKPGPIQTMEGFVKVEVLITKNLTEYDEMKVNKKWETMEDITNWKNSDAYKAAHERQSNEQEESPVLDSEIIVSEVVSTLE